MQSPENVAREKIDGKAIGTVEAKPEGLTLTSVEEHAMLRGLFILFFNKQKPQREIARRDRQRFRRVGRSVCIAASSQRRRRLAPRVVLCKQTA
jgi:hypothetical protein